MKNLLSGIEEILLMGPGPSCVHHKVYEALGRNTIGHLDPYFIRIMDAIKDSLRTLLNTENALTIPMSGTGSSGRKQSSEGPPTLTWTVFSWPIRPLRTISQAKRKLLLERCWLPVWKTRPRRRTAVTMALASRMVSDSGFSQ